MEDILQYVGTIYVRPCERGVVLCGMPGEPQLEEYLPEGEFEAEIVVRRKPAAPPVVPQSGDGYDVLTVSAGSPKPPAWVEKA